MPYYPLYRASAEIYLMAGAATALPLCVFGWMLLGRAVSKHLQAYVHWYLPVIIGTSFHAGALLLELFITFFDPRDYVLRAVVYLFSVGGLPFQIAGFVRLWRTVAALPPSSGEQPQVEHQEQDAGVWPPQPRRQP